MPSSYRSLRSTSRNREKERASRWRWMINHASIPNDVPSPSAYTSSWNEQRFAVFSHHSAECFIPVHIEEDIGSWELPGYVIVATNYLHTLPRASSLAHSRSWSNHVSCNFAGSQCTSWLGPCAAASSASRVIIDDASGGTATPRGGIEKR